MMGTVTALMKLEYSGVKIVKQKLNSLNNVKTAYFPKIKIDNIITFAYLTWLQNKNA